MDTSSEAFRSWRQRCQLCKEVRLWKSQQKLSWACWDMLGHGERFSSHGDVTVEGWIPWWEGMLAECGWISFRSIWVFPKIGVPQNGWFTMENPIKMDDLGVPPLCETPIYEVQFYFKCIAFKPIIIAPTWLVSGCEIAPWKSWLLEGGVSWESEMWSVIHNITTNLGRKMEGNIVETILMDVGTDIYTVILYLSVLDSKLKCQFLEEIGSQTRNWWFRVKMESGPI